MTTQSQNILRLFGGTSMLFAQVVRDSFTRPFYFRLTLDQIYQIGVKSIPLILIVIGSTGMVMALQFGMGLEKFGGKLYVPKLSSLAMVKELGPVFTSLMLAARVGAGMTSEIGSMTVTQQIDAIRALGTSPIKKIVIPRVLACLICVPLVCAIANFIGIIGGLVVGVNDLGLDPFYFVLKVTTTVTPADYISGLGKTFFFALFIAIPACYYGLNVKEGTRGVGSATTNSVVTASILIMVGDYFLTKLFWVIQLWLS